MQASLLADIKEYGFFLPSKRFIEHKTKASLKSPKYGFLCVTADGSWRGEGRVHV